MNARIAAVLVVLLVVLGGAALVYNYQERSERAENVATLGKPVLKDLKAADIAAIKIAEPKATITLQRKPEGWAIAERRGFPADVGKVRDFVLKLLELKVGQSEPIGDKDRARLNLDASGTQVELKKQVPDVKVLKQGEVTLGGEPGYELVIEGTFKGQARARMAERWRHHAVVALAVLNISRRRHSRSRPRGHAVTFMAASLQFDDSAVGRL